MQSEVHSLTQQLKKTESDRDQCLEKFEQSESLNKSRLSQKEGEISRLLALVEKVKATESESIEYVTKYNRQVRQLEGEVQEAEKEKRKAFDRVQQALN